MTNTLLRITTVSLTALSLTACMSGSGSPWAPEFGQAQAPHNQQSTYGQSQYQYAQYPMPGAQTPAMRNNGQDEMVNDYLATLGLAGSQHLSPLPNTYPPQPAQSSTWTGQQQYNSQFTPSATTQTYQQPAQRQNTESYTSGAQQSYQSPYTQSTPSMSAPAPYASSQSRTYGQTNPTPMASQQPTYGQPMTTPMATQRSPYGQGTAMPMTQQSHMYGQTMKAPMATQQTPYAQAMNAPMARPSIMSQQAPQSNTLPWGQAMAWMYQGHVKSATQSNDGLVTLVLHNGQTAETRSLQMNDLSRLKQDCGAVCQNMTVTTK